MKTMSALEAKDSFGLMVGRARAELVRIEKHGRDVVVVEYERPCARNKWTRQMAKVIGGSRNGRA